MRWGTIILCGGRSARMGVDKAALAFGPSETMLQRVVRIAGEVTLAGPIVCVARAGQTLPELPEWVRVVHDQVADAGPLAGLSAGLAAIAKDADAAFVASCDAPLLRPAFIVRLRELLGDSPAAAPNDGERWHPLAAVYRTNIRHQADALLAAGERSISTLLEACQARRVELLELREVDAHLLSLRSCNTPDEYRAALAMAASQSGG